VSCEARPREERKDEVQQRVSESVERKLVFGRRRREGIKQTLNKKKKEKQVS